MGLKFYAVAAITSALFGCAVPNAARCTPTSARVTGVLQRDLVGTWEETNAQGAPRYLDFYLSGEFDRFEPPQAAAPGAKLPKQSGRFLLEGGQLTLKTEASSETVKVRVEGDRLSLHSPLQRKEYRRVACAELGGP